jgi:hypothetical protein
LYCLCSVFCFIKMKIGLLTIGAALLSAQYVAGVDVRTRSNVRTTDSTEESTCDYEKFQKVVTFQTDDKNITKNDLKFKTQKWLKRHVVDEDDGKFTVTMNCDCCDPKGKLCTLKCVEGRDIHISAKRGTRQIAKLYLSNIGNSVSNSKFGELLFSSEINKLDNHVGATITSEYKEYGSRRRLLTTSRDGGC